MMKATAEGKKGKFKLAFAELTERTWKENHLWWKWVQNATRGCREWAKTWLDPPLHLALLWHRGLKQLWHGILSEIKTTVVCKDESQSIRLTYIMPTIFLATLACATNGTKLWLSPSAKQRRNPCSRPPPVSNHLSTCHDWPCYKCHCWFANQVTGIFKMYIL